MSFIWSSTPLLLFSSIFFTQTTAFSQTDTVRVIDLEEVKISVNRFEESARQQPAQVKQITKKDIAFQNSPNTADLLINSGDIFVQKSQGGGGSPVLRGFEASRVLLVVDGIRMNNAIYRSGHLQNVLRVDQAMLENTEVLFGPASLLYGSDALGGVIAFTTKQPKLNNFSVNAYARYGTAIQEKTGHVDFNIGGKKFASLTSLTASDFGDIIQGNQRREEYPDFGKRFVFQQLESNLRDIAVANPDPNKQVESGYSQVDFLQKLYYRNSPDLQQTLNFQVSATGNVPRYDRLSEFREGIPRSGAWYYGPELRLLTAYELRIKNRRLFDDSSIKLAFQKIEESRNNRRWNSLNLFTQEEDVLVGSINADFIKYADEYTYSYGVEYVYNDVESTAYLRKLPNTSYNQRIPTATRYPDGGSQMQTAAVYVTAKNVLAPERLFVNYGVRYSFTSLKSIFNDKTFIPTNIDTYVQNNGAVVGNAGLTFLPDDKTKLAVLFSNGFRVPNVDDLGKVFDSVSGQVVVPNADVKPETTYSFEVSGSREIFENLSLSVSAYYTIFDNVIVLRPFSVNGKSMIEFQGIESQVFANQNADEGIIYGGNINIEYKLSAKCLFSSTFNMIKGSLIDTEKTPLAHIPPNHGKTSFTYTGKFFKSEFFSLYNGWKRPEDYSPSGEDNLRYATKDGTPSWWTLNLRNEYQFNKSITAQLAVENILDKNYRYFASGISAPGRNLILTLRVGL